MNAHDEFVAQERAALVNDMFELADSCAPAVGILDHLEQRANRLMICAEVLETSLRGPGKWLMQPRTAPLSRQATIERAVFAVAEPAVVPRRVVDTLIDIGEFTPAELRISARSRAFSDQCLDLASRLVIVALHDRDQLTLRNAFRAEIDAMSRPVPGQDRAYRCRALSAVIETLQTVPNDRFNAPQRPVVAAKLDHWLFRGAP